MSFAAIWLEQLACHIYYYHTTVTLSKKKIVASHAKLQPKLLPSCLGDYSLLGGGVPLYGRTLFQRTEQPHRRLGKKDAVTTPDAGN